MNIWNRSEAQLKASNHSCQSLEKYRNAEWTKICSHCKSTAAKKWGGFCLITKQLSDLRWYSSRPRTFPWDESFLLEIQHSQTPCEYLSLWKEIIALNAEVQNRGPLEQGFGFLCPNVFVGCRWCHRKRYKWSSFKECLLSWSKHFCHCLLHRPSGINDVPLLCSGGF